MADLGFFRGERVELIEGIVVRMAPIGPEHASVVDQLTKLLILALGDRARVRTQHPLLAADDSEPEPDVAVVPAGTYLERHPDRAFLVVEVAASSLQYDRETKAPLYAVSNVEEYWIVDLGARVVEVYARPEGGRYAESRRFALGDRLALASFPDVAIDVGRLLGGA